MGLEMDVANDEFEGGIINRSSQDAMQTWSRILGAGQTEILIAVAAVGNRVDAVRTYLAEPWPDPA
jgi:hypothetical protein